MKAEKWYCNDLPGESVIYTKPGKLIAKVYPTTRNSYNTSKDVYLIKSAPQLLEALQAVYKDIELQNVKGGSDELNLMVQEAIKAAGQ